ncbi:methyltransferase-like protein 25 [Asterias rubens]|uniref:methyltransferase-like protein 25 n=1 Tax=Asterias rubens TaxID=7604 RepID=UPI001454EC20|nr:methyltransferase-like protein 25 [Asterias rubens]
MAAPVEKNTSGTESAVMTTEVNSENLRRIQNTLEKFTLFMERHHRIAKMNIVGFFTDRMWEEIIVPHFSEDVVNEIVHLSEEDMAGLPAGRWQPQETCENKEGSGLQNFINECLENRLENTDVLCKREDVLNEIEETHVEMERSTSLSDKHTVEEETLLVHTRALMNMKKCHEVERMSSFTARLAKIHHLQQMVDIGSGKGYLGNYLTLQYGLDVIGIDSSDSNTHGARERSQKLLEKWEGISKHTMNIKQGFAPPDTRKDTFKDVYTKRALKLKKKQDFDGPAAAMAQSSLDAGLNKTMNKHVGSDQSVVNFEKTTVVVTEQLTEDIQASDVNSVLGQSDGFVNEVMNAQQAVDQSPDTLSEIGNTNSEVDVIKDLHKIDLISDEKHEIPSERQDIHHDSDSQPLGCISADIFSTESQDSHSSNLSTRPSSNCNSKIQVSTEDDNIRKCREGKMKKRSKKALAQSSATFCPVTAFVKPSTSLTGMVAETSQEFGKQLPSSESEVPFMLMGLHTCGDLAPSMLRLFVRNDNAKVLLNIGCCYHQITERFETEGWHVEGPRPEVFGFPMSKFMRSKGTVIARPARILACMAADRIASTQVVPAMGLFYRSVLQVLLRDHFRIPQRSENVGKLAPKCHSFLEYARKALRKLKFDDSKLSDADIIAYSERFQPYFCHLQALNQLRVALSPTIEGLIMLDRLCYLQEQANVRRAAVIQLFDRVTSPRCYAIVATS